ncbi:MAG: hypothetical protein ACKO96_41150 [Flammeovirgaceae bacterium]
MVKKYDLAKKPAKKLKRNTQLLSDQELIVRQSALDTVKAAFLKE